MLVQVRVGSAMFEVVRLEAAIRDQKDWIFSSPVKLGRCAQVCYLDVNSPTQAKNRA